MEKFFFGKHVEWWIGIVERRNLDDAKVGCCKVRIFGYHTANKSAMPTESLPDAYPAEPLSGALFSTPREGDTVFGIFLDANHQSPLMLGRIPVKEQNKIVSKEGDGFSDARDDLTTYPRQMFQSYSYAASGIQIAEFDKAFPYPAYGQKSSLPFLARALLEAIPNQISPNTKKSQASITRFSTAKGDVWFELPTAYATVYPFNHVYESESLHVLEFDDTPGAERVHIAHRTGSSIEFFPDGSAVYKSVKDDYKVVLGDQKIGVSGKSDITINGDATLYVKGNYTQHIGGDYQLSVDGSFKRLIRGSEISNVSGDIKHKTSGQMVQKADGALFLKGNPLQHNSSSTPDVEDIKDFDLPTLPADTLSQENQKALIDATGSAVALDDDNTTVNGQVVNPPAPTPLECPIVQDNLTPFADSDTRYRMQISKYFQLADVSIRALYPHNVQAQNGLTQDQVICNLSFLARNSIDPITQQFPGARINCGFRKTKDGHSSHEKGEAVDLQWPNIQVGSLSKYMDIANWIVANVPFDQLILEHGNTIWLHVSLSKTGTNRKQVLTMKDGSYTAGLNLFGRT